jgi:hypothetical protein
VQTVAYEQSSPAVAQPAAGAKPEECSKTQATTAAKPSTLHLDNAEKTGQACENCRTSESPRASCEVTSHVKHTDAKWLMVSQPHVSMEYKIEDEGKSGVGKVEVWITEDNGKSWDILCDDPDKKSPVTFNLPHEGVFGICMSVSNGRGFGGNPPKAGDAPDFLVELDMTKPHAELRTVKMGPADENACIDISWQAEDKNLGSSPIDLYYSASSQGPWTPIAKGLSNSGKHRWYLPQELSRQTYVRLVVTDMAGNCSRCETSEPVMLDDQSRPHAIINGIVAAPGSGN